jgi:hypothetical protein
MNAMEVFQEPDTGTAVHGRYEKGNFGVFSFLKVNKPPLDGLIIQKLESFCGDSALLGNSRGVFY